MQHMSTFRKSFSHVDNSVVRINGYTQNILTVVDEIDGGEIKSHHEVMLLLR